MSNLCPILFIEIQNHFLSENRFFKGFRCQFFSQKICGPGNLVMLDIEIQLLTRVILLRLII